MEFAGEKMRVADTRAPRGPKAATSRAHSKTGLISATPGLTLTPPYALATPCSIFCKDC